MTSAEFANREKSRWPKTMPSPRRDMAGVEWLRSLRGVKCFEEMPESTRRVYLEVARRFPTVQVWACGSRVRGDYVEPGDGDEVRSARLKAGMKYKKESDFDFFISDSRIEPEGKLPNGAQRVRARVPAAELVEIPVWEKT